MEQIQHWVFIESEYMNIQHVSIVSRKRGKYDSMNMHHAISKWSYFKVHSWTATRKKWLTFVPKMKQDWMWLCIQFRTILKSLPTYTSVHALRKNVYTMVSRSFQGWERNTYLLILTHNSVFYTHTFSIYTCILAVCSLRAMYLEVQCAILIEII